MTMNRNIRFAMPLLLSFALAQMLCGKSFASESTNSTTLTSRTVLILGDSLAAGRGVDPEESFPALLQEKIRQRGWNDSIINAGVSGDTSAGGLRRLDWLLRQKIDVLVLELGGNDGLRGIQPAATRTNLQSIIDRTKERYPAVQVIVAGMKMPPNMGEQYQKEFENLFPELAKKNEAHLVPFLLENVGGHPELNQGDGIHPTADGHRIVAENVWKILEPVLTKINSSS
jgi:acyl-CoA thioesterase-1